MHLLPRMDVLLGFICAESIELRGNDCPFCCTTVAEYERVGPVNFRLTTPVGRVSSRLSHFYIKQVKSVLDNRDFG